MFAVTYLAWTCICMYHRAPKLRTNCREGPVENRLLEKLALPTIGTPWRARKKCCTLATQNGPLRLGPYRSFRIILRASWSRKKTWSVAVSGKGCLWQLVDLQHGLIRSSTTNITNANTMTTTTNSTTTTIITSTTTTTSTTLYYNYYHPLAHTMYRYHPSTDQSLQQLALMGVSLWSIGHGMSKK